jgi:parvulin-like peptidyl-prolyl isomerase
MQSIMINSSKKIEPSEKELFEYYKKNIEDYSKIITLSFAQIYFSNRKDKKVAKTFTLLKIAHIKPSQASSFGEKFIKSNHIKNISFKELKNSYGNYFASQVFQLKKGLWHKGIISKYGIHLVYVTEKKVETIYPFDEVQDRVYQDYLREQKENKEQKSYQVIKAQYILKVDANDVP